MQKALLLLYFDIELLYVVQVLKHFGEGVIWFSKMLLHFAATDEGQSHDSLGNAGKRYLLTVHVSRVGHKNADWHFFGVHLFLSIEVKHSLFIA